MEGEGTTPAENREGPPEQEIAAAPPEMTLYHYNGVDYPIYTASGFPVEAIGREFDFRRHSSRSKKQYFLEFATFDIETTSHIEYMPDGEIDVDASYGYMYIWQFCIDYKVAVGRTWKEFLDLLVRIRTHLSNNTPYFVVFVHNLSFEFQFLYGILQFYGYEDLEFFAISSRKVLSLTIGELRIEFRCSYRLTGESLGNLLDDVPGVKFTKMKGDLDYTKERTPLTELTPQELAYCYHDVLGLYDALKIDFGHRQEDICTVPLTKTGFVRRKLKALIKDETWYKNLLLSAAMEPQRFRMVRALARGGDTLASMSHPLYTVITDGMDSWDIKSSHPCRLLTCKYPLGKLEYEGKSLGKDEKGLAALHRIRDSNRYFITRVLFVGLELKDYTTPIPALMEYKAEYAARGWKDEDGNYIGPIIYNGRLIAASSACFCLDMPTWQLVEKQYTWKQIFVGETYSCDYDYLPPVVRNFVKQIFREKCELEIRKKKAKKGTEEYNQICRLYALKKADLNSIFGMLYTSPLRAVYTIAENGEWSTQSIDITNMTDEQKKELYKAQIIAPGQYLWGVHTAAMSRLALDEMIAAIGYDETVYSDTDSDKAISSPEVDERVAELNQKIVKTARERGATVKIGKQEFVLGYIEKETEAPYPEFVTGGAKKYCYREDGKLHIVISGVSQEYQDTDGTKHETVEQLHDDIHNFRPDFVFRPAGGNILHYRDQQAQFMDAVGSDGTRCRVLVAGSIYMTGRVVTLGRVFDTRGSRAAVDDMEMALELETLVDKAE